MNKISSSIKLAPLEIKPIKTPAHIRAHLTGASSHQNRRSSTSSESSSAPRQFQANLSSSVARGPDDKTKALLVTPAIDESNFDSLVKNLSETLQMAPQQPSSGLLSTSNSADLLSISPIFGKPFDTMSMTDESLATPAEDDLIRGIRNINYDIDFSDSPENSLAEEIAEIRKYNIASSSNEISAAGISMSKSDLEEFDPLMSKEKPIQPTIQDKNLTRSLIDESPNDLLLEDPLLPINYHGFSSQTSKIQSISCETGNNQQPAPK